MNTNYESMAEFIQQIQKLALNNPNRNVDANFIYSMLIDFKITNEQGKWQNIEHFFSPLEASFENNPQINVFRTPKNRHFLYFTHGKLNGNEIKMYVPLKKEAISYGVKQIFDFIAQSGISHQSKLADTIRNDNVVIRVNSLEEAERVAYFLSNDPYIKRNMLKVNPFLPNYNGIGMTMDNNYSYNYEVATLLQNYVFYMKSRNCLASMTVDGFSNYVKNQCRDVSDLDLKDIYSLIASVTSKDFTLDDFFDHVYNKQIDIYEDRSRVTHPMIYFERAIYETYKAHPGNVKSAIRHYMSGDPNYFTRTNMARAGLIKYVRPEMVKSILEDKLRVNGEVIPDDLDLLIDTYINLLLFRNQSNTLNDWQKLDIIKKAYNNTKKVYNDMQADGALRKLLLYGNSQSFTNRFGDRDEINTKVIGSDIRNIVLLGIDLENINIYDIDQIVARFAEMMLSYNVAR